MKLSVQKVIELVKEELLCYEDMEQYAQQWEKEFIQWVKKKYPKKIYVMTIKDEDEIFEIADSYKDAIEQNSIKQYWKEF